MALAGLLLNRRNFRLVHGTGLVLILAITYKIFLHDFARECLFSESADRHSSGFSWRCTRLEHPLMEGCEHLWLDDKNRKLYGACSNFSTHTYPSVAFDKPAAARRDHLSVMEIDSPPGQTDAYNLYRLELDDRFHGELDLHGFDAHRIGDKIRFWLLNYRLSIEEVMGDEKKNYTVEVFDLDEATATLTPVKTISSDILDSPNNLAVDPTGDRVLVINDHTTKFGPFLDGKVGLTDANLAECQTESGECRLVTDQGLGYVNGILNDKNGKIYVSDVNGLVLVYELKNDQLEILDSFNTSMGLDPMSVNAEDNILITTFPDSLELLRASSNPQDPVAGASLLLVKSKKTNTKLPDQQGYGYEAYLLITDEDGELMPSTTIAVHDVKTDRLFLTGLFSRGINICIRKAE